MKKIVRDFTEGPIFMELVKFSLPLILSNILQLAYNYVDMIIVGRILGTSGLSAVSNAGDVIHVATVICTGFAGAGQVLISHSIGRKDRKEEKETVGTMFTLLFFLACIIMIVGLLFTDGILNAMNVPGEAFAEARDYVVICMWGMIFTFGYNAVSSAMRGMGDSTHPFYFILVASVLNLILDVVFIAFLHMGVSGAALATIIGEAISFIACVVFLYKNRDDFGFDFRLSSFKANWKIMWKMVKLGIPMALQHSAVSLSKMFVTSYINSYGLVYSVLNGIGSKFLKCANVVCNALNTSTTSMIGQCKGAGKKDRIKKIVYISLGICIAYCALMSIAMAIFPQAIFSVFSTDTEVLDACLEYAPVLIVTFMIAGFRQPFNAFINGMGKPALALINVIVGSILFRAGLSFLLGSILKFGYMGFWYGEAFADLVPFAIGGVYFWSGLWEKSLDKPVEVKTVN